MRLDLNDTAVGVLITALTSALECNVFTDEDGEPDYEQARVAHDLMDTIAVRRRRQR